MTHRTEPERDICDVADLIAQLALKLNEHPLNVKHPDGWICRVDDNWTIAANGTHMLVTVGDGTKLTGVTLQPFNFAVWWNGWLAGTLNPYGGVIAGHPAGANEDTLIAALKKRIEEVT